MAEKHSLHELIKDCPFIDDHDTIIGMAGQIESIHRALYNNETGVLSQVGRTNSRVKKLELWRAGLVGAIGVLTPIVIWVVVRVIENHQALLKP